MAEGYKERLENYIDLADYEKIIEKKSQDVFSLDVFTAPGEKGRSKKTAVGLVRQASAGEKQNGRIRSGIR